MAHPDGQRRRHELVVKCRVCLLNITLELVERDPVVSADVALIHEPQPVEIADAALTHAGDVDLIEGQPVFYLVLIAPEHRLHIAQEEIDGLSGIESLILRHDVPGNLVVAQCDQRLDPVFFALVKHLVIESESGLIGLLIVPVREDPAPVDGQPETLEAHLREQRDVLLVVMIEVDRFVAGIKGRRICLGQKSPGRIYISAKEHVRDAQSFAILQIGPLTLVGRHRASPQKILRKSHILSPPSFSCR